MQANTPVGKLFFPFIVDLDEKSDKYGCALLIPKTAEGYAELTTDPVKQAAMLKTSDAWAAEFNAHCATGLSGRFGPDWATKKGLKNTQLEADESGLYWVLRSKTGNRPSCADRQGAKVSDETEIRRLFSAGNWGVLYVKPPLPYDNKFGKGLTMSLLDGVQYACDGEPVTASGPVEFKALPDVEVKDGDFAPAADPLAGLE